MVFRWFSKFWGQWSTMVLVWFVTAMCGTKYQRRLTIDFTTTNPNQDCNCYHRIVQQLWPGARGWTRERLQASYLGYYPSFSRRPMPWCCHRDVKIPTSLHQQLMEQNNYTMLYTPCAPPSLSYSNKRFHTPESPADLPVCLLHCALLFWTRILFTYNKNDQFRTRDRACD